MRKLDIIALLLCGRCSGSDAVNLTGSSYALLTNCTIEAKKVGLKAFDKAKGQLQGCDIKGCKDLAILLQNQSKLHCTGSAFSADCPFDVDCLLPVYLRYNFAST